MSIDDLFSKSRRINQSFKRNIIYMAPTKTVFSELLDDDDDIETIKNFIMRARENMSVDNEFYYTAAIEYPFKTEPYMASRYSDGTYPVWYGSETLETTFYETVYHTKKYINSIAGIQNEEQIVRWRSIYDVHCEALMLDVTANSDHTKELTSNDYRFTQNLGRKIKELNVPGLLSLSARHPGGINGNVFKQDVLSMPKMDKILKYIYSPLEGGVKIIDGDAILIEI